MSLENVPWETLKRELRSIVADEDETRPLSDDELLDKLRDRGFPVSRRTVVKYRRMLRLRSPGQWKDWRSSP